MPTVWPASTSNETPSTARTIPSRVWNQVFRSRTSSRAHGKVKVESQESSEAGAVAWSHSTRWQRLMSLGGEVQLDDRPHWVGSLGKARPLPLDHRVGAVAVRHLDAVETAGLEDLDDRPTAWMGGRSGIWESVRRSLAADQEFATRERSNSKICFSRDSRIGFVVLAWTR